MAKLAALVTKNDFGGVMPGGGGEQGLALTRGLGGLSIHQDVESGGFVLPEGMKSGGNSGGGAPLPGGCNRRAAASPGSDGSGLVFCPWLWMEVRGIVFPVLVDGLLVEDGKMACGGGEGGEVEWFELGCTDDGEKVGINVELMVIRAAMWASIWKKKKKVWVRKKINWGCSKMRWGMVSSVLLWILASCRDDTQARLGE